MPRRDLTIPLLGGLGIAVLVAFTQRRTIMLYGSKAIDAAHEAIWTAQLPSYARPYAPIMLRVAREEGVDPNLIFALGDRETLWGTSKFLDKPGPEGRGDGGHGYGLMQIDDRDASNTAFIASGAWRNPYSNVSFGVKKLKRKMAFFTGRSKVNGLTDGTTVTIGSTSASRLGVAPGTYRDPRPLSGSALWEAAIASYNTGEGNVLKNLAAGKPAQVTTAGGDYVTDVNRRASNVATQYDRAVV